MRFSFKNQVITQEQFSRPAAGQLMCSSAIGLEAPKQWHALGTPRSELTLDFTLPTGQSFRWRKAGDHMYTGVICDRLVLARGPSSSENEDLHALKDYFNLHEPLASMSLDWAASDERFKVISPYFPGARILRQDPTECLFQFICSSNNHISRIHGMVERLCMKYGTRLNPAETQDASLAPELSKDPVAFYAFPTLEQLARASEADLRADGFGYRAKFVTGSVAALLQKEGGGNKWLHDLRKAPYREAVDALVTLPGIGPKVAACICLFALDKHEAIPVDTHVWQLALKYYTPNLKGKTLTPKLMQAVENAFIERFGPYAGWAHNVLFISDLASSKQYLPPNLRPGSSSGSTKKTKVEVKVEEEKHEMNVSYQEVEEDKPNKRKSKPKIAVKVESPTRLGDSVPPMRRTKRVLRKKVKTENQDS